MRAVNKLMVLFSFLSLVYPVSADDFEKNGAEMILLAHEKMRLAILESDKTIGVCLEKETKTTLLPQVLPKLPLSKDEWKTALTYLYLKAVHRCEETALATALMAMSHYKYIIKKITGKSLTEYLKKGGDQAQMREGPLDVAELFYFPIDFQLKYELRYKKIDPKARLVLEAIPELNQSFSLLVVLEALGY